MALRYSGLKGRIAVIPHFKEGDQAPSSKTKPEADKGRRRTVGEKRAARAHEWDAG
jgi:hypothetical protein